MQIQGKIKTKKLEKVHLHFKEERDEFFEKHGNSLDSFIFTPFCNGLEFSKQETEMRIAKNRKKVKQLLFKTSDESQLSFFIPPFLYHAKKMNQLKKRMTS